MYEAYTLYIYVMGVRKMGNIVLRAGIKPTSLAFRASLLPLHQVGSLTSPLFPCLAVYASPCLTCQFGLLHIIYRSNLVCRILINNNQYYSTTSMYNKAYITDHLLRSTTLLFIVSHDFPKSTILTS